MKNQELSNLIYGKDETQCITSIEVNDGVVTLHKQDGSTQMTRHEYFILWAKQLTDNHHLLDGDQYYKYYTKRETKREWNKDLQWARKHYHETSVIWNETEQYMIKNGVTYYKGMNIDDLNVLSFDIETTGLKHDSSSKVLIITNTYHDKSGNLQRKMFTYDDYDTPKQMIAEWCAFVNDIDPHIMTGHNIIGFDLPYIKYCYGTDLPLGRSNKKMVIEKYERQFRKDGSQTYGYNNVKIPGREVIDTWMLSIKYDVARRYPNYKLKDIIKYEGLEAKDRQHYDAGTIRDNYKIPEEWTKIKSYAEYDADDSYNLFYLMSPAYFYYAQSVSKPFQEIILGATGSQINNIMVRSYIQNGHSIPKASGTESYEGGISFGNCGIYTDVNKVDVASMYPSIILDKELYSEEKDPDGNLLELTKYFTAERLKNKQLFKDTKDRKYDDLQGAQKIVINSIYGFLGCGGLNFNSPSIAATITSEARKHLQTGIDWATVRGYDIVNADTDSFMYTTGEKVGNLEFSCHIKELNSAFTSSIVWCDDGQFSNVVIVKAKNYAMKTYDGAITIKGSGLKGTMKEEALRELMTNVLYKMLDNDQNSIRNMYGDCVKEICDIKSIDRWVSKKTITKAVLTPNRTQEERILAACFSRLSSNELSEGDKIQVFFKTETELCMKEDFTDVYHLDTLLNKTFKTIKIFDKILDMELFPNYKLKRNKPKLEELCQGSLF